MKKRKTVVLLCLGFLFALLDEHAMAESNTLTNVVTPPVKLKASQVLPETMLHGPGFWLEERVVNDGFINTYTVKTPEDSLVVESTDLLKIRYNELVAVDKMKEMQKTDAFAKALKSAASGPLHTFKGLITSPVNTVKGTLTGIGRWFSDVGRSITSDDPHQESVVKTALGFAAAKRKFAFEMGIDSYTSFQPAQENLGELAWASVAGGLTVKVAFSAIQDTPGTVVRGSSMSASMSKLVRDKSPEELEDINTEKLEKMGISKPLIEHFLSNGAYNPQETTFLVAALESMPKVQNKEGLLTEASRAKDESIARFTRIRFEMIAGYNKKVSSLDSYIDIKGSPGVLSTKDGRIIGVYPLDYVASTKALWKSEEKLTSFINELKKFSNKEIWISGMVSPEAHTEFANRGWKVVSEAATQLGIE